MISATAQNRFRVEVTPAFEKQWASQTDAIRSSIANRLVTGDLDLDKVASVPQGDLWRVRFGTLRAAAKRVGDRLIFLQLVPKNSIDQFFAQYARSSKVRTVGETTPVEESSLAKSARERNGCDVASAAAKGAGPVDVAKAHAQIADGFGLVFRLAGNIERSEQRLHSIEEELLTLMVSLEERTASEATKVAKEAIQPLRRELQKAIGDRAQQLRDELASSIPNAETLGPQIVRTLESRAMGQLHSVRSDLAHEIEALSDTTQLKLRSICGALKKVHKTSSAADKQHTDDLQVLLARVDTLEQQAARTLYTRIAHAVKQVGAVCLAFLGLAFSSAASADLRSTLSTERN